jgi:hypothetical protein
MTPKKNIIRNPTYTLPDGSGIPSMGLGFTKKESAFIFWYSRPESESFLNGGRAAVRAGYKANNAVTQGYLLKQKPRIAAAIHKILSTVQERLHEAVWRIAWLCRTRMFFDVTDFYRPGKRIVKTRGKEAEIETYEIVPLNELSYEQRMCIDGIDCRGLEGIPVYRLPNRDKEFKMFAECIALLFPDKFNESGLLRGIAISLKVKVKKGLKGTAAYLRGE